MQAGDRVFVAYAITGNDPTAMVYGGTVLAVAERGDAMIQSDIGSVFTAGGPFGGSRLFASEGEAWRWSAEQIRGHAEKLLAAADKADERADGVALQAAGA